MRQKGFIPILIIIVISLLATTGIVVVSTKPEIVNSASKIIINYVAPTIKSVASVIGIPSFPASVSTNIVATTPPMVPSTPLPMTLVPTLVPTIAPTPTTIKCLGIDGLYSYVAQETCSAVKKFWDEHPTSTSAPSTNAESTTASTATPTPTATPAPTPIATSSGALSPGTIVDNASTGVKLWTSPSNAQSSNDQYTNTSYSSTCAGNSSSHYLKSTNFGFNLPSNATISGILVAVERKSNVNSSPSGTKDKYIYILKGGNLGLTNKADTVDLWPTTDTYASYGGSDDLWGENWTASDINSSDFGVAIAVDLVIGGYCAPCFDKNTLISTPQGYKKISNLKTNDAVYSFDEASVKISSDTIVSVIERTMSETDNKLYKVYLNSPNPLIVTGNQLFYSQGRWIAARNIKAGDILLNFNLIPSMVYRVVTENKASGSVWDLTVNKNHNFFANNILVHNDGTTTGYVDNIQITVYYTY